MAHPTAAEVWAAIQSAVEQAAGCTTIWKYQDAPQPALDYVAISLGASIPEGVDYVVESPVPAWAASTAYAVDDRVRNDNGKTYRCTTAGTSASSGGPTGTGTSIADGTARWAYVAPGGEIQQTLGGTREVTLQLEVFSDSRIEQAGRQTAMARCEQVVGLLRMPAARAVVKAVGFVPFDPGPVQWVPAIVGVGFRGRATCEIRCRVPAYALRQYTGYIASLAGTATVHAGAADVDVDFEAP